jgi:hypothetical protein
MRDLAKFLGVEEEEKFTFGGNDVFSIEANILFTYGRSGKRVADVSLETLTCAKIIHQKRISEDEKVILRNLPEKCKNKYIARDKSNKLYVFENKPMKRKDAEVFNSMGGTQENINAFKHLFQCVQW